jgi:exosortase
MHTSLPESSWNPAHVRFVTIRAALVVSLCVLAWPPVAHAVEVWSTDEEFTYGFLILPIALAIIVWRRHALQRSVGRGENKGLIIVICAILLLLISRRTGINALGGLSISPLLFGVAMYLWGRAAAQVLAFPAVFLAFGLGLYRGLLNSLGFALQDITARGAVLSGQAVGLNVVRDGLVLHSGSASPQFAFVVAQTCSGMSSLLSLLALAALWMYATRGSIAGRLLVFAGVLPLVIVANTLRVTLVLVIAAGFGEGAALGFFHGASSLVLFGVAVIGLLVISRTVGCRLPTLATSF